MPAPYRRILFWTFLLFFFVTAPLLILYTAGYRYNWQRGKIQETGVLTLDYKPTDATLTLNNEVRNKKPPFRIPGLIPGRYVITIAKEGYYTWEKRLWIEPSKTTFAQHMILWKKDVQPTLVQNENPLLVVLSPNKKTMALVMPSTPTTITLFDTQSNIRTLLSLPQKNTEGIRALTWSPNSRRLFIEGTRGQQFVSGVTGDEAMPIALQRFVPQTLEQVTWNTSDDDHLYGYRHASAPRTGYELVEIDLFRGAVHGSATTFPKKTSYMVEDDLLYRVENDALFIVPFLPSRALERRLPLPSPVITHARFLSGGPDGMLTLFDPDQKRILLIDKETRTLYPIQETIDDVRDAVWSPRGNRLVWSTGKALWLLDLEQSTRELVVTENKKIQDVAWDPENEYLFYTNGETVDAVEVDNRDERNRVTLSTIKGQHQLFVGSNGETLWTLGELNSKKGLLALTVSAR